jgi:hypothetical protein
MVEDSWQKIGWIYKLQGEGKQGKALKSIEFLCPEYGGNKFLQIVGKPMKLFSFTFMKSLILTPPWGPEISQS